MRSLQPFAALDELFDDDSGGLIAVRISSSELSGAPYNMYEDLDSLGVVCRLAVEERSHFPPRVLWFLNIDHCLSLRLCIRFGIQRCRGSGSIAPVE
jgi:hypothetical protein